MKQLEERIHERAVGTARKELVSYLKILTPFLERPTADTYSKCMRAVMGHGDPADMIITINLQKVLDRNTAAEEKKLINRILKGSD